jgi:putative phosphoribosyl transferase
LPPLVTRDRTVLLVDDGLATGATMRAAVRSLRLRRVGRLVVAVPVAAAESAALVAREVDELVCLHRPEPFLSVGLHYEQFDPTADEDVDEILSRYRRRHPARSRDAS